MEDAPSRGLLHVFAYSLAHLATIAVLGQLILLGFGGIFEFFENIGFTFRYIGKPVESLLVFAFFYYLFRVPIFRIPALLITSLGSITALLLGRSNRSIPNSFAFGALSPFLALLVLAALCYEPTGFLSFSFAYGYTAIQALICSFFAAIGAYSASE